jgi:DNA-binding beta-propeller fold protein YncE
MKGSAALAALILVPALLGITVTVPGQVTTMVNPRLFTAANGDEHLHGIVRDPISGDIYVGDWQKLSVGATPWFGPYIENRDTIRRINELKEVSVVTYMVSPRAMTYSTSDRDIYIVLGSSTCHGEAPRSAAPGLNGVVALDPRTGTAHVLSGGKPGFSSGMAGNAQFAGPVGIATDPHSGAILVSEACQNRIRVVDAAGDTGTLAGSGAAGHADGVAEGATFNDPHGIAYCEHDRRLYVADTGNNEIRTVNLESRVTTIAGAPQAGFIDGRGLQARFNRPTGVACDNAGNVYVADSGNNAIRMIAASGEVSTIAGNGVAGTVDGIGAAARFSRPGDITYDAWEHALYVVDWNTNQVRKVVVPARQ